MHSPVIAASSTTLLRHLSRLRKQYLRYTVLFAGLTIGAMAWYWSRPKEFTGGFPFLSGVVVLLLAALLINAIAFFFQFRYMRRLLQQPQPRATFSVAGLTLRFYLYQLITAFLLSVIGFFPLITLLFYYWIYPVAFWLIPYPLLTGLLLGRELKSILQAETVTPQPHSSQSNRPRRNSQ